MRCLVSYLAGVLAHGSDQFHEETGTSRKSHFQNPPPILNTLSSVSMRESRIQYLCDPQWFRDTASRGPTTTVAPQSQFRTCPSDHDSIGYPRMSASGESSTTMHRLLHASGSHPIPPPNDPKTNQYNQDLGLIHSTNGNHLESPNEGSSIDHQVTIYLHAQNITMFPTNETWYFASQITSLELGRPYPHFDGPID
ncbi:callose synthase 7 [Dorcoceras hygrometricum]|uniref:Callose synthase 7 n=1 Tax=Dorcoceras hygrometricum TaxID=472368 RepID=A0A2Z7A8X9_9LAMI|nr:callose synthase 7 [Dorcoceras hygrometricum]